jgi:site-specific DNA recombinase
VTKLLFAFVGRVSTEEMQEPEASRARQIAKASTILPPSAQIVADYFDIGDTRALPWPRRPETGRLLRELRSGTNTWNAIVVGEFTRAFGAPIQYSTTYPLLQHFGIELWLPEIGGRVDFNSTTTEMLLGMLGGTSKQERDLIRVRVRDGMMVLAEMGGRHLGGRPPYGYRLADAGEHPNAKKRALGQRLHRLEPDPVTTPVVRRIFEMFAAGQGLKQIANILTAKNVPSPAAHDPKRNPHRDPRGWAHTVIRTILLNEKYVGRGVWGKQVRTDELYDLDDVAAGYITRQRWANPQQWVYGPDNAHPPLIEQRLWDAARARLAVRSQQAQRGTRSSKTTMTPYMLRGLVHCGICERKMQGNTAHGTLRLPLHHQPDPRPARLPLPAPQGRVRPRRRHRQGPGCLGPDPRRSRMAGLHSRGRAVNRSPTHRAAGTAYRDRQGHQQPRDGHRSRHRSGCHQAATRRASC